MQTTSAPRTNAQIVTTFFRDSHTGRLDVIDELVDPAIVTHGFPGSDPDSRASYRAFFESLGRAFADMSFDLHAIVSEGDLVDVRFTVRGEHRGEYLGVTATGRRVEFDGMVQYRVVGGRITETWLFPDNVTLLRQLGVLAER